MPPWEPDEPECYCTVQQGCMGSECPYCADNGYQSCGCEDM